MGIVMQTITQTEYDKLKIIMRDDTLTSITTLSIGELYLIKERDDCYETGDIVSLYKVINKTERSVESIPVLYKIK